MPAGAASPGFSRSSSRGERANKAAQAIETFNDGTNERIRGLNESIGYVYDPPYVTLRGPLPG